MKFSYDKIEECSAEMSEVVVTIKDLLEDITGEFNSLESKGCWQGNAFQNYFNKAKRVTEQFETVNKSLDNNVEYLNKTIEGYSSLDKKIVLGLAGLFDKSGSDN